METMAEVVFKDLAPPCLDVDSKVKGAFTRAYKKAVHRSQALAALEAGAFKPTRARARKVIITEDGEEEDDIEGGDDEEDDDEGEGSDADGKPPPPPVKAGAWSPQWLASSCCACAHACSRLAACLLQRLPRRRLPPRVARPRRLPSPRLLLLSGSLLLRPLPSQQRRKPPPPS